MNKDIEIPLNKTILLAMLIGALVFFGLGLFFLFNPNELESTKDINQTLVQIISGITLFIFGFILIAKKIIDDKMGLIINSKGITDNSNGTSIGLVEWKDIVGIRTVKMERHQFIVIDLHDNAKYINYAANNFLKMSIKANIKMYGSPVVITCNSLKIKFSEAEKLIKEEFNKRNSV